MRIGIDIDNCISNFDDVLLEEYIKHDKKLRNTGIINDKPYYITEGMFDWSKEENDNFYYNNIQRIAMSLKPLNNAKEVIDKLKADGNEIYIITSRDNGEYINPEEMTREWLKKYDIVYDKLILTGKYQKGPVCREHKIDIMSKNISKLLNLTTKTAKVLHLIPVTEKEEKELQILQRTNLRLAAKVNDELNDMENIPKDDITTFLGEYTKDVFSDIIADDFRIKTNGGA